VTPSAVPSSPRLLLDTETNVGEVLEEVYENESRQLGGEWAPATVASTDAVSGGAAWGARAVGCRERGGAQLAPRFAERRYRAAQGGGGVSPRLARHRRLARGRHGGRG